MNGLHCKKSTQQQNSKSHSRPNARTIVYFQLFATTKWISADRAHSNSNSSSTICYCKAWLILMSMAFIGSSTRLAYLEFWWHSIHGWSKSAVHHYSSVKLDHESYQRNGELDTIDRVKYQIDLHECHSNWRLLEIERKMLPILFLTLQTLSKQIRWALCYDDGTCPFFSYGLCLFCSFLFHYKSNYFDERIWLWMCTKDLIVWHNCELQHAFS